METAESKCGGDVPSPSVLAGIQEDSRTKEVKLDSLDLVRDKPQMNHLIVMARRYVAGIRRFATR